MGRFRQSIAIVLVAQLVLGPGGLAWGQAKKGDSPSRSRAGSGTRPIVQPVPGTEAEKVGVISKGPAEEPLPGGQALSRAVLPDRYVLGPGDALSITLWGEYDDQYATRVTPDGRISIPTIGTLQVTGLTLAQVEALIGAEVQRYYRNVKSSVSLTALRVFEVLVLGEVRKPGAYLATPVKRVSDVIADAGGVLPGGSQRSIQVQRDEGDVTADMAAFLRQGDQSANPFLRDGDVIFVPPMGDRRVNVYISEIASGGSAPMMESSIPYTVELKEGERVSTLTSEVGGVSPWWDVERIFIQRASHSPQGTMRIPVDLRRYFIEKDESQNVVLESGDEIYIPASIRRVFVAGAVKVPAAYVYLPGRPADRYIAEAGGLSLAADLEKSFIKKADGTVEPYVGAAEIANGDTIVVLEKTFKVWQDYVSVVAVVTGLFFTGLSLITATDALQRR